jgi:hypothetical protein
MDRASYTYSNVQDVLENITIDRDNQAERKRLLEIQKQENLQAAKDEVNFLVSYINKNANAKPHVLVGYMLLVITTIFFIYYVFLRKNVTGEWYDDSGNLYYIKQNMITNTLEISAEEQTKPVKLSDNKVTDENGVSNTVVNTVGNLSNTVGETVTNMYSGQLQGNLLKTTTPINNVSNSNNETLGIWDGNNKIIFLNNVTIYRTIN